MKQNGKVYNAIFLDRDGVLNKCINIKRKCFAPTTFNQFRLYPFVISSIKKLKGSINIIIISHKKEVVEICDKVYNLNTKGLHKT